MRVLLEDIGRALGVPATMSALRRTKAGIYGLNNYAGSIADDVRLEMTEYTLTELADATEYYRNMANDLAGRVRRDENSDPVYSSFHELAIQAAEG